MLNYNDLKPGTVFILDSQPYQVLESNFLRMQQRKPVAQTKIKNLITGKTIDRTFYQNENFQEAKINVPLFIKQGDIIKINTQTGQYVERINF